VLQSETLLTQIFLSFVSRPLPLKSIVIVQVEVVLIAIGVLVDMPSFKQIIIMIIFSNVDVEDENR